MRAAVICSLLLLALQASATTIVVDHAGSGDYLTIQEGIDAASNGDTVQVACGTYREHDIVMKSGITLRSETGLPECVTIDADSLGRVMYCADADSATVVEGLTITRGLRESTALPYDGGGMYWLNSSPRIVNCSFVDNEAHNTGGDAHGGAIAFYQCSPTVAGCSFSDNIARTSWPHGATYGGAVSLRYSDSTITDCEFFENTAHEGGAVYLRDRNHTLSTCEFSDNCASYGGGIETGGWDLHLVMEDCVFEENEAHLGGGAIIGRGSIVSGCVFDRNTSSSAGGAEIFSGCVVTDCRFVNNYATSGRSGGVECFGPSVFESCTISGNTAGRGSGGISIDAGTLLDCAITDNSAEMIGGGVLCGGGYADAIEITDCVIAGNVSYTNGGGIACADTLPISIVGCTISDNTAWEEGGAVFAEEGVEPVIERSILAFSHAGGAVSCDSTATVTLAECDVFGNEEGDWTGCIAGQESIAGNFSSDPLFCDMYGGDYTLCANSPCLPASWERDLVGALGQGCDNCDSPVEGNLFVTSCEEESVTLRWVLESLGGCAGLRVYRAEGEPLEFQRMGPTLLQPTSSGVFVDDSVWPGTAFTYQLRTVGDDGGEETIGEPVVAETPGHLNLALSAPTPNPSMGCCELGLELPFEVPAASVAMYDIAGRLVRSLHDGRLPRGRTALTWNGLDAAGNPCAAGVYFVRCDVGQGVLRQRIVLIR